MSSRLLALEPLPVEYRKQNSMLQLARVSAKQSVYYFVFPSVPKSAPMPNISPPLGFCGGPEEPLPICPEFGFDALLRSPKLWPMPKISDEFCFELLAGAVLFGYFELVPGLGLLAAETDTLPAPGVFDTGLVAFVADLAELLEATGRVVLPVVPGLLPTSFDPGVAGFCAL